jgi:hypothetical protein
MADIPTIVATERATPPRWALMERFLIDVMNRAGVRYVERYTRSDGTLVWRDEWPGMDGSDDAYESFTSFPLFYALGGSDEIHRLARKEWNAVTWQFTGYGQIHNEFDGYYDWMHHGESSLYFYYFGLADPYVHQDRVRALRFARMYTGSDPDAPNWDAERRMIRSPINGSRGPRFEMSGVDWVTHRPILAHYLCPYEDLPGLDTTDPMAIADWNDDETFERILKLMNERMVPGDVPLNLQATSLVTNAYLYNGDPALKRWVLDYLSAWEERTRRNNGIMPDNVGPNDIIGERMNGKWWGGYYGWRWPHGAFNLLEATLIAGSNALLMTGEDRHLDLHRSQLDLLWSLGERRNGVFQVPFRHGDKGWFSYRPPDPRYYIHLYFLSQSDTDRERLDRLEGRENWGNRSHFGKGAQFSPEAWFAFIAGQNPELPEQILAATYNEVCRRMEKMRADDGDPTEWDVHHWQDINPIACEALLQLTMGSPGVIYHGGLLHARVRYFDPANGRPGLSSDVAALVTSIEPDSVTLTLVNTDPLDARDVLIQAGAFGEHAFTTLTRLDSGDTHPVNGKHALVRLLPATQARVSLGMRRYVHAPTYEFPWRVDAP